MIAVGDRAPNVPVWPSMGASVRVHASFGGTRTESPSDGGVARISVSD